MEVWGKGPAESYALISANAGFAAAAELVAAYPITSPIDDAVGITVRPVNDDFSDLESVTRAQLFNRVLLARFATGEIIAIQTITPVGNGTYQLIGILRGLDDTDPTAHAQGELLFIPRVAATAALVTPVGWTNGESVELKAVPLDQSTYTIANATPATFTIRNRALRPYAVSDLHANGRNPAQAPAFTNDIVLWWTTRNRGSGIGYDNPQGAFDPNIISEADLFVIEVLIDGALVRTVEIPIHRGDQGTSISAVTSASEFEVADPSSLAPGRLIRLIQDGVWHWRRVKSVAGDAITLIRALPAAPSIGDAITITESASWVYTEAQHLADNGGTLAAAVTLRVRSKLNGWESLTSRSITVTQS
jgi:hypothetical protein